MGFLGRVIHGASSGAWLKEVRQRVGEASRPSESWREIFGRRPLLVVGAGGLVSGLGRSVYLSEKVWPLDPAS